MKIINNSLYSKISVNSIYTFSKETTDEDIINIIIHDLGISLYELIKEHRENLKIDGIPMSKKNILKCVWNFEDDSLSGWKTIYENKTDKGLIDVILSEMNKLDNNYSISREIISNIFPDGKAVVFNIFRNDKINSSKSVATYNILTYNL